MEKERQKLRGTVEGADAFGTLCEGDILPADKGRGIDAAGARVQPTSLPSSNALPRRSDSLSL